MRRTEVLKKLIHETGLSMRAFSEKAAIPNTTLHSMLERGIGNASVDNVIKVCKTLGITIEQLEKMALIDPPPLKEESAMYETGGFTTAEAAIQFILKQPALAAYGGYDINEMSDEEIIEFANELLNQLKLLGFKYKR